MVIPAVDLRIGMVVVGDDGEVCRVEVRELRPPTPVRLTVALTLRRLDTGAVCRVVRAADTAVELAALPERELECLYLTDIGCVLFDPDSASPFEVAHGVGLGLPDGPRTGQRLVAGFWQDRPVTLRPALPAEEAELAATADGPRL